MTIRDFSIVARFHPEGYLRPGQYLARVEALFAEAEWVWTEERARAHVFPSHLEAQQAAEAHRYQDAEGKWHTGWALVLERAEHPAMPVEAGSHSVTPRECFEQLEKRGLA